LNARRHKLFIEVATALPLLATLVGVVLLWRGQVGVSDLVCFALMYTVCILGLAVGYHRLLAHRSFEPRRPVRLALATAGTMAGQGPVIIWVAHHRRHHRATDKPGDPHSPHVDFDGHATRGLDGWWHAHLGWLFDERLTSDPIRYTADLLRDPAMRWLSKHFTAVVLAGIALPGLIGFALTRTPAGFLTGALWGGLIRMFAVNQVTYAVNSFAHLRGRQDFATTDESRNVAWLALVSFGESWHNNHHAFPRAALIGLRRWQFDPCGAFVVALEKLGLARNVVRITPKELAARQPAAPHQETSA
jgi:stearoyl-CoA desaturase (delta-9 desaturase)